MLCDLASLILSINKEYKKKRKNGIIGVGV